MRNGLRNALILLLTVCTLFLCTAGASASMHEEIEDDVLDMDISVGFDGKMTYGKFMPIRVKIRNFGDDFEGVLGLNAYVSKKEYDRYEKDVFVPAGSEREFDLVISVYARQNTFTAQLMKDGETVCAVNGAPSLTVNPSAMLVGVFSTTPQNLNNLNLNRENDVLGRYELWQTIPLKPETFPEDVSLLNSFGILVFDDIDPAQLSHRQQDALDSWIRSGRIVICGGGSNAARNTAFFGKYTGLKLDNVGSSDSVLEKLEELLGRSASGKKPMCVTAQYSGGEALTADSDGYGLIYRTTAGAGRIYTTAFDMGETRINSEPVMNYFWQQLLVNRDMEVYSSLMSSSSDGYSSATITAGYYAQVEANSFLLRGLLIVAGVPVLSCIVWAVLKKRDKRQWMWLALPVIAAIASVSILLLSGSSETNRPLAVIADNLVQDGSGVIRNYSGISVAAPEFGRHSYSMGGEKLRVQNYDYVDYDEEQDEKKQGEPDTLRTCYSEGGESAVTAESLTPWAMINLSAQGSPQIQGRIDGSVWMEDDGLHGEIINETDIRFQPGKIVTTYGYVSVPALAPGDKAEFVMCRKQYDPKKSVYADGELYPDHPGLYSVICDATGYNGSLTNMRSKEAQDREMASSMINGASDVLRQSQGNYSYGAYDSAMFLYAAEPENMPETILKADGVPVEQKRVMMMMTAELPFEAVGRTGKVFRSAGMDVPERVETDENRLPTDKPVQNAKQMYYHSLSEMPTFRFVMEGMEDVKVESMQIVIENYYAAQCRVFALNAGKHEWEEIRLNEDIKDPGQFIDRNGKLYIQFRNDSQDMYADIPTPMINLEGSLEYAEN